MTYDIITPDSLSVVVNENNTQQFWVVFNTTELIDQYFLIGTTYNGTL